MKRSRVLLINPRMCRPHSVRFPLSVLALGAVLENFHDYEIIDGNVEPDPIGRALQFLDCGETALVGVTVMPGPQVAPAIEISAAIRAAYPATPIAWGGYFPTLYPAAALNAAYVDYVVRGQGERTMLDLLDRLPQPDADSLREIPGLSW